QQYYRVADTNDTGALRDRAIQDFRRRRMGKAGLKVMFDGPEMAKANLFRLVHLLEHLVEDLIFTLPMLQRAVDLDLVKNAEIHRCPPGSLSSIRGRTRLNVITISKSGESSNS